MELSMKPNYLHLDLKGLIPEFPRLLEWLEWFAALGYNGIVWEYEDRIDWQSWPGIFRPGYSMAEWEAIWQKCRDLNLEIIPLVQTHGHLEWLLKDERYATWRENGCWNEICPQNEEAVAAIKAWLGEVRRLHPESRYIHIGADETWNLATCPACQARSGGENGRLEVYLRHLCSMSETALQLGFRPIAWGDMFRRENRPELAACLPAGTILVDWRYYGPGPWPTTRQLRETGLEIWGGSGISRNFDYSNLTGPNEIAVTNVQSWRKYLEEGEVAALIHTTWSRARSLLPPYGPWERCLPGFLAGGSAGIWEKSALQPWMEQVDEVLKSDQAPSQELMDDLAAAKSDNPFEQAALEWWHLTLRYRKSRIGFISYALNYARFESLHQYHVVEPDYVNMFRRGRLVELRILDELCRDIHAYLKKWQWTGADEFVAGRRAALESLVEKDWAEGIIPETPPCS